MASTKTEQSIRILASFTPSPKSAETVAFALFGDSVASGVVISSGRLILKYAIKSDFSDVAYMGKVAERVAAIKAVLAEFGTVHSFDTAAGAVPIGTAEDLHEPEPEPDDVAAKIPAAPENENDAGQVAAALASGWLPNDWRKDPDVEGGVIVPDAMAKAKGKARGSAVAWEAMTSIKTESGEVLKAPAKAEEPA